MMSIRANWEYLRAIHAAAHQAKGQIRGKFCATTGYHRKSALRLLHGPRPGRTPPVPSPGGHVWGPGEPGDLGGRWPLSWSKT